MGRRIHPLPPRREKRREPVAVSYVVAHRGWTWEQARDLLRQGYTVEHVARTTGFAVPLLRQAQRTINKEAP